MDAHSAGQESTAGRRTDRHRDVPVHLNRPSVNDQKTLGGWCYCAGGAVGGSSGLVFGVAQVLSPNGR